jgi:hypothetical protein
MNVIQTKHNLDFEVAPWEPIIPMPFTETYAAFRVGTCEGLYCTNALTYDILAVKNLNPGNGHFEDVLQWFENSCRRDKKNLRFLEVMNKDSRNT